MCSFADALFFTFPFQVIVLLAILLRFQNEALGLDYVEEQISDQVSIGRVSHF